MKQFIVTANRDAIDKGDPQAVRVENTKTGEVREGQSAYWNGPTWMVSDPDHERQDGARVWVETNSPVVVHSVLPVTLDISSES